MSIQETIERLLEGLEGGDRGSVDELFALVYDELKHIAHRQRQRWSGNNTLNTTALVHEVYVKLIGGARVGAESRAHFRALAARAMRHVLCDYARGRATQKRGGGHEELAAEDRMALVEQAESPDGTEQTLDTLVTLDAALRRLEELHPRASRIVECRFFGGLTVQETAAAVGVSPRSVKRDWAVAQAWLHREMDSSG